MCLQNLFCSLEHVYQERKKKVLSLLTIYFLVTASWDLELDKQMDFPEGVRPNARVCVYIFVCMWQTVFIHAAVLVWWRRAGTVSNGRPLPQRCISPVEHSMPKRL